MDDVTNRLANLSPVKRALLELKIKQQQLMLKKVLGTSLLKRVSNLSATKRAILELKLTQHSSTNTSASIILDEESVATRVANLSPIKQALLKLKIKHSQTPAKKKPGTGILRRIAGLSATKRALLEQKVKHSQTSAKKKPGTGILRRIADLSATKRALLEQKVKHSQTPAKKKPGTGILRRIAGLSATKRALLEQKVKHSQTPPKKNLDTGTLKRVSRLSPAKQALLKQKLEQDSTDSTEDSTLANTLVAGAALSATATTILPNLALDDLFEVDADPQDLPDNIPLDELQFGSTDIDQPQTPSLVDFSPASLERPETLIESNQVEEDDGLTIKIEKSPAVSEPDLGDFQQGLDISDTVSMPDWLADDTLLDDLETPSWLTDINDSGITEPIQFEQTKPETDSTHAPEDAANTESGLLEAQPGLFDDTQAPEGMSPLDATILSQPKEADPGAEAPTSSSWLDSLKAGEINSETTEAAGMLAGLGAIQPPDQLTTDTIDPDNLAQSAQDFYHIATQAPAPATLPVPVSRREKVVGGALKASLYLLFVVLLALPFLPGTEKIVNGTKQVPWTEPLNFSNDVLDNQRRQLISEELGVIDQQQPGSVALVSFDYSNATQGEMQPLADAVMGRLKGQGMRLIAVSLEPEGAAIAQKTLKNLLVGRNNNEAYGVSTVNLGYLPGQVAAIRGLASNSTSLATIADFEEGIPLNDPSRSNFSDIETLKQVDVIVTFSDNPVTARWWVEQLAITPADNDQALVAATSAAANPFLQPYRANDQLNGLVSGINGAAAIEATRNTFGPARQMIDSLSIAHLIIVILIAVGTIMAWMPNDPAPAPSAEPVEKALDDEEGEAS